MANSASGLSRCEEIAAANYGVIALAEALAAGMSRGAIYRRVESGAWIKVFPRVFRVRSHPETWQGMLRAAFLWAGPDTLISHRSAAALYGLDGFGEGPIDLTVTTGSKHPKVRVFRPRSKERITSRPLSGLRVTSVERTLVDVCGICGPLVVGRAMDDALRRKLTTIERLHRELARSGGNGRPGSKQFRTLLQGRDDRDGRLRSLMEAKMWKILKRIDPSSFVPDFEVHASGRRYFLDFALPSLRIGIECQGARRHGNAEQQRDLQRHRDLTLVGWTLVFYAWDDVCFLPKQVETEVRALQAQLGA